MCVACGLGLILFDSLNPVNPNFTIRLRAIRTEPDMFYVNRNLKLIETRLFRIGGTHSASTRWRMCYDHPLCQLTKSSCFSLQSATSSTVQLKHSKVR